MQTWGAWSMPPVAVGRFCDDKGHQVSPVSTPVSTEGSEDGKFNLKDKRVSLEQEIVKLKKKYAQEVNLHRALERALKRPDGVLPRIPSYLPAKVQKLLAEVAVLEEEVIRLEDTVVYLRKELTDETQNMSTLGAQKQPNNFNANDLSKPNLAKIKVKKESPPKGPPPKGSSPVKDLKEKEANKFWSGGKKPEGKSVKDAKKNDGSNSATSKLPFMSFKSNSTKEGKEKDRDEVPKDVKDRKESKVGKDSVEPAKTKSHSPKDVSKLTSPKDNSKSPKRSGVSGKAFGPTLTPAPTSVARRAESSTAVPRKIAAGGDASSTSPARKAASGARKPSGEVPAVRKPAAEALSRFQGLQPWKPSGGANGKNGNQFRTFNSVGWNEKQPHLTKQQSSSPRKNGSNALSSVPEKHPMTALPKGARTNSPKSTGSIPKSVEKENLQSSAVSKIVSKSPRGAKVGFSVDFETSSVVDRKASLTAKTLLAQVQPAKIFKEVSTIEPNRLSEELVKCLVSIYSKLAKVPVKTPVDGSSGDRTSDAAPATIDFYGVCRDVVRDIGTYKHIQEITVETIDSSGIGSCTGLYKRLGSLMEQLGKADLQSLTHHEKLAFWINIYNVCMMHAFLERGIPSSPSKVVALMRKGVVNVGGYVVNALTIEHFILRLPTRPKNVRTSPWKNVNRSEALPSMAPFMKNIGMEELLERSAYGLDWHEPLVTFGLCCGSRSSPALRAYTPGLVQQELETAKREYLEAAIGVNAQGKLLLPKLLEWYMRDFAKDMELLLEWVCSQLTGPLRDDVRQCLDNPKQGVISQSIEIMPYDFNFRYLFLV